MLTKEECRESLSDLYNVLCNRLNEEMQDYRQDFERLEKLIEEHFKDKKNLEERFKDYKGEIPKDNPWGDRYADECSKEEINKWIWEGYGIPPIREKDDVD